MRRAKPPNKPDQAYARPNHEPPGLQWTNQEKPLTLAFTNSGIYGEDNECMFGDMGSIYVHIDPKGKCVASAECYCGITQAS